MADRIFKQPEGYLANRVVTLSGPIAYVHSGTTATSNIRGVTSVTYSATGVYTIQLDDRYNKLLGCYATMLFVSVNKDITFTLKSEVMSTGVIVLYSMTGASPTAIGADATIYLTLILQNSAEG